MFTSLQFMLFYSLELQRHAL